MFHLSIPSSYPATGFQIGVINPISSLCSHKATLRLNLIVSDVWKVPCVNQSHLGLYFKPHGTHRPYSTKKTVIKRWKRVPAGVTTERMTEQITAEGPVAVGRLGGVLGEGSDVKVEQPKKERARRGEREREKEEEDAMVVTEEEQERPSRGPVLRGC